MGCVRQLHLPDFRALYRPVDCAVSYGRVFFYDSRIGRPLVRPSYCVPSYRHFLGIPFFVAMCRIPLFPLPETRHRSRSQVGDILGVFAHVANCSFYLALAFFAFGWRPPLGGMLAVRFLSWCPLPVFDNLRRVLEIERFSRSLFSCRPLFFSFTLWETSVCRRWRGFPFFSRTISPRPLIAPFLSPPFPYTLFFLDLQ